MPTTTTTTPGSANKKARTWERHRWSFEHDAWSKKFGGILKSWTNVGLALEQTVLFQPWGHLKTDMLRRRYDKLYSETLEALRKKGVDLDAIGESEMTDLERKCLKVRNLQTDQGMDVDQILNKAKKEPLTPTTVAGGYGTPGGSGTKKSAKAREEELVTISDAVTKFLLNNSDSSQVGQEYLTTSVEMIANLADSFETLEKGEGENTTRQLVKEMVGCVKHLVRQNDLLLGLLTKVLSRQLT